MFFFNTRIPHIRFEEPFDKEEQKDKIGFDKGIITIYPCNCPIKRIKLRWRGDMSDVQLVQGDDIARYLVDAPWRTVTPHAQLWWYFHAFDGELLNSFGVKTDCASFVYRQCDTFGITLWLDVRNGGGGADTRFWRAYQKAIADMRPDFTPEGLEEFWKMRQRCTMMRQFL